MDSSTPWSGDTGAARPMDEAGRLAALRSYDLLNAAGETCFDNIVQLAARMTGCPIALISLVEEDHQWFLARRGLDAWETSREVAFCAQAILNPMAPLIVPDAALDPRFARNPLVTGAPHIRFYAGSPLVDSDGRALGTLCVIDRIPRNAGPDMIDALEVLARAAVTALELRRATRRLKTMSRTVLSGAAERRNLESRLRLVVESWPNAMMIVNAQGCLETVNAQTARLFGYDRAELLGQPVEILIPEQLRGGHVRMRLAFMSCGSARTIGVNQDLKAVRKDGSEFPVEIILNPFQAGGETQTFAVVMDITQRRAEEQARERERQELARSNADLAAFAHVVSHDLKAPLRAIDHLAAWIAEDIAPAASPETLENLALMRGRVTRLQGLLDGLRAYSSMGHAYLPVEPVDVRRLIAEIVEALDPPRGFAIVCDGVFPILHTNKSPLRHVLQNLIGNGLKHHDRDTGTIRIACDADGATTVFCVSDDGPGIPPRFHERIFTIFQTLAARDDVEGSGIGLTIVKKAVEDNGGWIRVESGPPARGAAFVFSWNEAV